jgi:hypothetical protein
MTNLSHYIKLLNIDILYSFFIALCPTQNAHGRSTTYVSMENSYRTKAFMLLGKQVVKTLMARILYKVRWENKLNLGNISWFWLICAIKWHGTEFTTLILRIENIEMFIKFCVHFISIFFSSKLQNLTDW